jgi:hypothetical protein
MHFTQLLWSRRLDCICVVTCLCGCRRAAVLATGMMLQDGRLVQALPKASQTQVRP